MAKRLSFPTRKKTGRVARKPISAGTFIQRSRSESSEQKAMWHNVQGAGRSHVRREFFDLTDDEADACREQLAKAIDQRIRSAAR